MYNSSLQGHYFLWVLITLSCFHLQLIIRTVHGLPVQTPAANNWYWCSEPLLILFVLWFILPFACSLWTVVCTLLPCMCCVLHYFLPRLSIWYSNAWNKFFPLQKFLCLCQAFCPGSSFSNTHAAVSEVLCVLRVWGTGLPFKVIQSSSFTFFQLWVRCLLTPIYTIKPQCETMADR